MAFADGITIDNPTITIDGVDYLCTARSAMLTAEDDEVDISNFCNPKGTRPGATDWTAEIELELTYGEAQIEAGTTVDAGTWNTLHALRKTKVEVVMAPGSGVASVSNPTATFEAYIPTVSFMNGEVAASDSQRIAPLMLSPIGDPVFDTGA